MLKKILPFVLLFAGFQVNAALIDFEDLNASDGIYIPQGYNGFSWGGAEGNFSWVNNAGSPIGATAFSGSNFAWSNGGAELSLSGQIFDISSMWLSTLGGGSNTPTVTFEGFLNGVSVSTSTLQLGGTNWLQANLNFTGIDTLIFDGDVNTNLLVDDISYNTKVPEPSVLALMGLGLAGLGFARRRKAQP